MSVPQYYSQDEIQQILNLAITHQAYEGEFTRTQLVEIATELGITTDGLQLAEQDWRHQQLEQRKRASFHQHRLEQFKHKLGKFAIANTSLLLLNFLIAGSLGWSLYILLFWGAAIAFDAWKTYNTESNEYQQAYQQWERKKLIKNSLGNVWKRLRQAWEVETRA